MLCGNMSDALRIPPERLLEETKWLQALARCLAGRDDDLDGGLVHEDLARRGAPPRISFRRTDLDARDYELRVVNYDGVNTIPFTLTLKQWD